MQPLQWQEAPSRVGSLLDSVGPGVFFLCVTCLTGFSGSAGSESGSHLPPRTPTNSWVPQPWLWVTVIWGRGCLENAGTFSLPHSGTVAHAKPVRPRHGSVAYVTHCRASAEAGGCSWGVLSRGLRSVQLEQKCRLGKTGSR